MKNKQQVELKEIFNPCGKPYLFLIKQEESKVHIVSSYDKDFYKEFIKLKEDYCNDTIACSKEIKELLDKDISYLLDNYRFDEEMLKEGKDLYKYEEFMKKYQKHFIIALIAGVLIYFGLPEANGLTNAGVRMLAVFIPTIYLWLTCGTGWTSLLSVTVAVMLQVAPGASTYMTLWGNICGAAVIPFLMVASVMEESGAFEWIVKWIISRRFIHGRPTLFMVMFTFAMSSFSIFTAPQVVAVLFFRLLYEVAQSIGYTKEDSFYKAHGLLVGWIAQICDGVLIWGRPYVLTMVAVVAGLGFANFTAID